MYLSGAIAMGGAVLRGPATPSVPLLPIETIAWQHIPSFVFDNNPVEGTWDHETSYYALPIRNMDRSWHTDENGKLMMLYTGDSGGHTGDWDQGGLALGDDVNTWSRFGSVPLLPYGQSGYNQGDTQPTSAYFTGSEVLVYIQGNATPREGPGWNAGDDVTIGLMSSPTGKTVFLDEGRKLGKGTGSDGDANDMYRPQLVVSGHDGVPWLFYTGRNMSGTFGLMAARSPSGNLRGPWVKTGSSHMLVHGTMFLEDAWYENGIYQFIYMIGGSSPGGLWLATWDGIGQVQIRRQLLARRPGFWDAAPVRGRHIVHAGMDYLFFDVGGGAGIGYVYGE